MAGFRITGLEEKIDFTVGSETISLTIKPLSRCEKMDVAGKLVMADTAGAERALLAYCVRGWDRVNDPSGKPIPFTQENLDVVLGLNDELGRSIHNHLMRENGLSEEAATPRPFVESSAEAST